jgi:hypothetical protein
MSTRQSKFYLIAGSVLLIYLSAILIFAQTSVTNDRTGCQESMKLIPFSITAGVPVAAASIRVNESVGEASGIPFHVPVVVFPPREDSFITQSVTTPPDLQVRQQLFIEVFFSTSGDSVFPTEGSVRLTLAFQATGANATGPIPGVGLTQEQLVEVTGGGLKKVTFVINVRPLIAESDVLTIQIGRQAKDNAQDTNPGDVRIEAVRISYGSS